MSAILRSVVLAAVVLGGLSAAAAGQNLSIATGGTAGMYYPYGGALGSIWSRALPGINARAEVTGGSVINVALVIRGDAEIALSMANVALDAYRGGGKFPRALPITTLFAMYANYLHGVTRADSGIEVPEDLRGRTVSLGAPGSGTAVMAEETLAALEIGEGDMDTQRLNFAETSNAIRNGTIDAGFLAAGLGTAAVAELAATREIDIISYCCGAMEAVNAANPAYVGAEVPAGTYHGVDEAVLVPTVWNLALVHRDMDEDLAYELTRVTFENLDELHQVSRPARATTIENTLAHLIVPLHPGAARYFREQGADIPDDMVAE